MMKTAKNILKAWRAGLLLILWAVMFLAVTPAPTYADTNADEEQAEKIRTTIDKLSKKVDSGDYTLNTTNRTLNNDIKELYPSADDKVVDYIRQYLHENIYLEYTSLAAFNSALSKNFTGFRWGTDAHITDAVDRLNNALEEWKNSGTLSLTQLDIENRRIKDLIAKYQEKARELVRNSDYSDEKKKEWYNIIDNATNEALDRADALSGCPTVSNLRERYQSGCWSCLVVNKLITAFLTAAEAAYEVGQRAGLVLLGLGAVLGILLWGLRNVSSLAQVDPLNILNDLMKFCFKILLAYLFITSGVKMVGKYIVNPIMGTGAEIAQQFWDDTSVNGGQSIRSQTEGFDWGYDDDLTDEQYAEMDKLEEEAKKGKTEPPAETNVTPIEYSDAQQRLLDASGKEEQKNKTGDIPNFIIPPLYEGWLTSPVGCRLHPTKGVYKVHKGLDVGTQGRQGGKVMAAAGGTITYLYQKSGAGYYAKIEHGNGWVTKYFHMQKETHDKFRPTKNNKKVVQGEQIGFVGNTGGKYGVHLHFEVWWKGRPLDPLSLLKKKIVYIDGICDKNHVAKFPEGFGYHQYVPKSAQTAWTSGGTGVIDLSSTYVDSSGGSDSGSGGGADYSQFIYNIPEIKYTGPTAIMSKSVMNSILGATRVITNTTAENLVLGHAITCYSGLDKGGAWHIEFKKWGLSSTFHFRNIFMWIEGVLIWCAGFLLTLAVAYYLLDVCYKVAFAVIALPIVVGLWPFNLTKDKFAVCVSIIAKAAATFAFLAMTTSYGMRMVSTVLDGGESGNGLQKILDAMDVAFNNEGKVGDENVEYVTTRLDLFSINFVLLMFAFIYFFRLVSATVSELVNKFFPDNMFGNKNPMHQWATAATKYATDIAKKPFTFARDVALHQTGRAVKYVVRHPVKTARGVAKVAVGTVKLPYKAVKFAKNILGKKSVGGSDDDKKTPKKTPIIAEDKQKTGDGKTPIIAEDKKKTGGNGGSKKKHSRKGKSGSSNDARRKRLKNKRQARKRKHRK